MSKISRTLILFLLFVSVIPTASRFFYYEYKFSSIENIYKSPIKDLRNVESFPSGKALQILSNDPTGRVFTFRQADFVSLNRSNWIDNFDPRAKDFYLATSEAELFKRLIENEVKYVMVPNYSWPTIYNTVFKQLLSNPFYSKPLIENIAISEKTDSYQLYKIQRNQVSVSCSSLIEENVTFLKKKGSLTSRAFDSLLGIPTGYQSGLDKIKVSDFNKFENIGLNKSMFSRLAYGSVDWYQGEDLSLDTRRLIIKVQINSDSLVSLSVQGISSQSIYRNLLKSGRLVNVTEARAANGQVSLNAQVLLAQDVGSIRIYLRSFAGPRDILGPISIQICEVSETAETNEVEIDKHSFKVADMPYRLSLDLENCDFEGVCQPKSANSGIFNAFNQEIRSLLQGAYHLTQKLFSLFKSLDAKLLRVFEFAEEELQPYTFRCVSGCPESGIVSLEWTNRYGFITSLILSPSEKVFDSSYRIFAPSDLDLLNPHVVLSNYSGSSKGTVAYEFWREYVKK
jgi:hypothetical protein